MKRLPCLFVLAWLGAGSGLAAADGLSLEARVADGPWTVTTAVECVAGQKLSIRVKPVHGELIRWFRVVPDTRGQYHNAEWPGRPGAYKWLGYAEIPYGREPLPAFDGQWEIEPLRQVGTPVEYPPSCQPVRDPALAGLGSFWFQAEVTRDGRVYATPGAEATTEKGLSPAVMRVSVRQGDDFLGHLTSFLNVPAVFGSTPYQVRNHIAVDCADVLMAAYAKWKKQPIDRDYNVAALTSKFPTCVKATIAAGEPETEIRWGADVREGDLIAVRYQEGRQFQHIGTLYRDENRNGRLDGADYLFQAGPDPLHVTTLGAGDFDGSVLILRPK